MKTLLKVALMSVVLASSGVMANGVEIVTQESDLALPVTRVFLEENTPRTIEGLVNQSTNIVIGEVVDVKSAGRIYHSGTEDRDRSWYEQVKVVFKTQEIFKGEQINAEILWTAYTIKPKEGDGKTFVRTNRVEIADMMINETNVGDRYVLFMEPLFGQLVNIGAINGVQPVDRDGRLLPRNRRGGPAVAEQRAGADSVESGSDHSLFANRRGQEVSRVIGLTSM